MPPFLQARNIGKKFGPVTVLQEVSFDVRRGEIHVVVGENGAGKSTLMRILSGVYTDYEGTLAVAGETVRFRSPLDAARHGISMVHQELSLVPQLGALDNIFLGRERGVGRPRWLNRGGQIERAQQALARLGLDVDWETPVEQFSMAVRQLIEIAKCLAFDAQVLILDEPTSALDKTEVQRLEELLRSLRQDGKAILYITHKMEEIYRLPDRITVLRDGKHICTEPVSALSETQLISAMIGREWSGASLRQPCAIGPTRLVVRDVCVPDPLGSGRRIVDAVSFEVRAGEVLGIAGLEGSGNHELLLGLFGGLPGVSGTVHVDGNLLGEFSPAECRRAGMALLPNDRKAKGLVADMSILHNMTLAALDAMSLRGWIRQRIEVREGETMAGRLALRHSGLHSAVSQLSGGNQQKVVLARWLLSRPSVFLLDDPTRGVDIAAKQEIYRLINECTAQGMAIVMTSSETPELRGLADRILVLHRGRITGCFPRDEATQERILAAAMGVGAMPSMESKSS